MTTGGKAPQVPQKTAAPGAGGDDARRPLPPQGASLAVIFAVALATFAAFAGFLTEHQPRQGWTSLAVGLVLLNVLPGYLPGLRERRALSRARKEAVRLVEAVRAAIKKQKGWTGEGIRAQLEEAVATLEGARVTDDLPAIEFATQRLDELADEHLVRKTPAREYVEQIGTAVLAALLLRAFFYEAFKIPSASMVPTLLVGDHLFVNKFVYGLRIPFTLKKLFTQVPERGDIVVFNRPGDESGDDVIKRVIGLPGDRVEVRNRHVTVCPAGADCAPLETRDLGPVALNADGDSDATTDEGPFDSYLQFEEQVGRHRHVMQAEAGAPQVFGYNEGSWTVEPGHVFVMGDNRDNSQDSRFGPPAGFGQVPLDYVKGRADIIWLSVGGPHGVRFNRFFSLLP